MALLSTGSLNFLLAGSLHEKKVLSHVQLHLLHWDEPLVFSGFSFLLHNLWHFPAPSLLFFLPLSSLFSSVARLWGFFFSFTWCIFGCIIKDHFSRCFYLSCRCWSNCSPFLVIFIGSFSVLPRLPSLSILFFFFFRSKDHSFLVL